MVDFLMHNISSIMTLLLIILIIAGISLKMSRDKKLQRSTCGCGCSECHSACNTKKV